MCQDSKTDSANPVEYFYATPDRYLPDPTVLIRRLDPHQMACLFMGGVFSDKILKDDSLDTYIRMRTGYLDCPFGTLGTFCTHVFLYRLWIERLKVMNPLHYYWLSQTGCIVPHLCPSPGSELAKWVAASVAPYHLPHSFYVDNKIDPKTAYQPLVPAHAEDSRFWLFLSGELLDELLGSCSDDDLESKDSETEVMSGSE
ncbi:uncharacterized protein J3D65DRAFT_603279 [Phyllosticta citribraziliensis]|uniref:Uncharacterized protein n=1 Tax=Phyllosticta citribraziliensis TaxID=989973 RepID=A0ABR1LQ16_9PEZI